MERLAVCTLATLFVLSTAAVGRAESIHVGGFGIGALGIGGAIATIGLGSRAGQGTTGPSGGGTVPAGSAGSLGGATAGGPAASGTPSAATSGGTVPSAGAVHVPMSIGGQ